ncbi:NAD(P)-dependent alcohol dehydrogenase [Cellulosimicrobium arenosum]|uniref:NAD(P)-dependent alcohol dehydrogenase n=1 Tax=Cellulosimicrobium arenosum TaxID=2708133 RepID=A0A927PEQ0_9MICO|nr:NAD(P)-dependent alcohol dehydrogenase [Cellulosimicrobium arenosum]MBD8079550.1 NAD(P)-dependent alcohol dehydrogenase [Cellulosimicrobium arenosum]
MLAAVSTTYGPPEVVHVAELADPAPGAGEILVRNRASTIEAALVAARSGTPWFARLAFGLRRPRHPVLGGEVAGEVVAVGDGVTRFSVGDRVVGLTHMGAGAHAELVVLRADGVVEPVPDDLTAVDAAVLAAGPLTALPFLAVHARVRAGQSVLVIGASGCVGTAAVQVAVHTGAQVTAVCGPRGTGLVRELGATGVVDRTAQDFTATTARYDVVLDAAGVSSYRRCRHLLTDDGVYLTTVPSLPILWRNLWTGRRTRGRRGVVAFTGLRSDAQKAATLRTALSLGRSGALRPVVDATYSLDEIADAHRHVEDEHKAGTVVVRLD